MPRELTIIKGTRIYEVRGRMPKKESESFCIPAPHAEAAIKIAKAYKTKSFLVDSVVPVTGETDLVLAGSAHSF